MPKEDQKKEEKEEEMFMYYWNLEKDKDIDDWY